jgi:cytochrome b subunit of formate dehydrogenase
MLPRKKDFADCIGMWKWFFVGGKKPKFDRWTYWEKFDYVAEVGGSFIIGVTGLMLWFPTFFSRFMPGWVFNVATIVHGDEALLALGFIFTIHFFNAHLRLEKFPVDDVMFTGRLPEEEFKEERGAEYERLEASGELEKLRVPPPKTWYRPLAVIAGLTAMAIGTTLVVLIILAGLELIK